MVVVVVMEMVIVVVMVVMAVVIVMWCGGGGGCVDSSWVDSYHVCCIIFHMLWNTSQITLSQPPKSAVALNSPQYKKLDIPF